MRLQGASLKSKPLWLWQKAVAKLLHTHPASYREWADYRKKEGSGVHPGKYHS